MGAVLVWNVAGAPRFAFNPASIRLRIASGRVGISDCARRQSSTADIAGRSMRTFTASVSTAGRPLC